MPTQRRVSEKNEGVAKLLEDAYKQIRELKEEVRSLKTDMGRPSSVAETVKGASVQSKKKKNKTPSGNTRVALFVDTENVTYKKINALVTTANTFGNIVYAVAYDRPSSGNHWQKWAEKTRNSSLDLKEVRGKQSKDLVDNAVKTDVKKMLADDKFDVLCLASGDGGYTDVIQSAKTRGKTTIVMYTNKSSVSHKLAKHCDKIIEI